MQPGNSYIVKTDTGVNTMTVIAVTTVAVKVCFGNGCQEWIYKTDFKSNHSYIDPKKIIIEQIL